MDCSAQAAGREAKARALTVAGAGATMNGMKLGRRQFVLGAVGAAAAITSFGGAAEPGPDPIIDTHQHLWDLKRFKLPWLANAGERLNRSYRLADYAKA